MRSPSDVFLGASIAPPTGRRVALPTGASLYYVEQGSTAGEPIVLLHGYTDSSDSFARLAPLLPDLRLFALDQRGHGQSDKDLPRHTMADFAADVLAFLDAMRLDRATLIGHCMGGLVAQRVALDHPERVARLVLISATSRGHNAVTQALMAEVDQCTEPLDPAFVTAFQRSTVFTPVPEEFFARVVAGSLAVPIPVWRQALTDFVQQDFTPSLVQLRMPTLIVWGEHDAVFGRSDQETLLGLIPNSTLHVLPACGHAPHWEAPEQVAHAILAFVRGAVAR